MDKQNTMNVLDNGKVDLVDCMGSDLTVCNAARVSFAKETDWGVDESAKKRLEKTQSHFAQEDIQQLQERDQKLIRYLAKHNHWTPFAHPQICIRETVPIFVARQLVKHQIGLVWNEVSRRYVDSEPEFYLPFIWRGKPENKKQGSSDEEIEYDIMPTIQYVKETYNNLLKEGVAPEMARMVLPQNMYTEYYGTVNLNNLLKGVGLRAHEGAQQEIQDVALACLEIATDLWPQAVGAFRNVREI